jgi:transposase-like protein
MSPREESPMPQPHPPEFRQRAVELVQLREQPIGKIAADLGVSESCLRRWVRLNTSGKVSTRLPRSGAATSNG